MSSRAPAFCGLILAAGASSRMGSDKALLPWPPGDPQGTFLGGAIASLQAATDMVIVVAGVNAAALRPTVFARAAFLVENPQPERGQFSSLRAGLRSVLDYGRDAAIVTLVDRPPVQAATVAALRAAFVESDRDVWAVVPSCAGTHGHPIVIGREMIEALLRAPEQSTAREVLHQHATRVRYVDVDDSNVASNVNTPDDYARLGPAMCSSGEIKS
ncbi:MAG TPA: nucleotidyltransferase family protein [Clostridia bacterium]|nr:nucleotidyltransferase family protein [Clostridia bacterium]